MCGMILHSRKKRRLLIVLCIVLFFFTIRSFILIKQTDDDTETTIRLLFPNDSSVFKSSQTYDDGGTKIGLLFLNKYDESKSSLANFQLSDEKYVYTFFWRNGNVDNINRSTNVNVRRNFDYVQTSAKTSTIIVNELANNAFINGMDYFVLISGEEGVYDSLYKDRIVSFIQKLKTHIIPNVGVVVNTCINREERQRQYTKLIIIQKSHMEIFKNFFPQYLDFEKAIEWIVDVYKPYHITYTTSKQVNTRFQGIRFEHENESMIKNVELEKNTINGYILSKYRLFVVSYSLYGSETRYTDGAIKNARLITSIYPSWKMWIYHDDTVPETILSSVCRQDHITCINMTGTMIKNKMSWRFLVASVPFVLRYIVRDIDSRLSVRERAAVDEWIQSGEKFHVMRDHPSHSNLHYPINGGMWGGTREAIPNIQNLLKSYLMNNKYLQDMNFLSDIVWPIAQTSIYQHDSFSCDKFGGGHPFPTQRIGLEHVGGVFINGKLRKRDTHILKNAKAAEQCIDHTP